MFSGLNAYMRVDESSCVKIYGKNAFDVAETILGNDCSLAGLERIGIENFSTLPAREHLVDFPFSGAEDAAVAAAAKNERVFALLIAAFAKTLETFDPCGSHETDVAEAIGREIFVWREKVSELTEEERFGLARLAGRYRDEMDEFYSDGLENFLTDMGVPPAFDPEDVLLDPGDVDV